MRKVLILLLLMLLQTVTVATPQNYRKAQVSTSYFVVSVTYPEKANIGDTVRIVVEINVIRESEIFEVSAAVKLITPEYHTWGYTFVRPSLVLRLKNVSSGFIWKKAFNVNITDEGVVLAIVHVRYGNLILGKPIPVKTDSIVVGIAPTAPEYSYAVAFALTKVKTRLEETIELLKGKIELLEERLGRLQKELVELRASYASLEGERNMLRENVKTLTKLNTLYSTGFYLLLFATITLMTYCLSLRGRLKRVRCPK